MEKSKTIEILETLANGPDSRSESSRLADIIDDVENALKAGVKRQAVLNALHDHYGFKMTMSGFEKALRKLRKNKQIPSAALPDKNQTIASNKKQTVSNEIFLTPQDRRNFGTNALKEIDKENYIED